MTFSVRPRVLCAACLASLVAPACAVGGRLGMRVDLSHERRGPELYGGPAVMAPLLPPKDGAVVMPGLAALFSRSEPLFLADMSAGYNSLSAAYGRMPTTAGGGLNLGIGFGEGGWEVMGGICGNYAHGTCVPHPPEDDMDASAAKLAGRVPYGLASACLRLSSRGWLGFDVGPFFHVPVDVFR